MRRTRLVLLILVAFLLTGSAFADSVTMTLTSVGGNNGGGVYTYPYLFSVNGGSPVSMICDTFDNEVVVGETWKANVNGLLSGSGLFGNQTTKYEAAGLIFLGILNGSIDATKGNWAIWGLFSTNAQANSFYASSGAAALAAKYLALAPTTPLSTFDGLVLYTPIAGSQPKGYGTPQEYIARVPEPGEIALLGTLAVFAVAMFVSRKRLGMNIA